MARALTLALCLVACEPPRPWAIVLDHPKLGRCLASGGTSTTEDGETTVSAGTVLCVRSQHREAHDRDAQHTAEGRQTEGDAAVVSDADALGASTTSDP